MISVRIGPWASATLSTMAAVIAPTKLRLVSERAAPMMKSAVRVRFICPGSKLFSSVAQRPAEPG